MPEAPESPAGPASRVRVLAIGVVIQHDHVLLAPVVDKHLGEHAYRALGGGVDFGERAADAVVREFREEMGCAVEVADLIGVSENLFTFEGRPGHEVVFQFHLRFSEGSGPANLDPIACREDNGEAFDATWVPLAEVVGGMHTVYPEGFPARLAEWVSRQ
jgi:ADP-ribose pyrophosphatase YjhB (NUDIX family)